MDRFAPESPVTVRPCLSADQIEAIARQLPGRQERDLMRLQQAENESNGARASVAR